MNLDHLKELPPEVILERLARLTHYIEAFQSSMHDTASKEPENACFKSGCRVIDLVRKQAERILN